MIELAIKYIKGKPYQYGLCSRCGVWIPWEEFNPDETHTNCDKYAKTRSTREKAEKIALGRMSKR